EFASDDLEQRLRAVPPMGDDETGVVIARRARQVAKHLRRSAEAAREVGIAASKTWSSLRTHFGDHMGTRRPKGKQINLQSGTASPGARRSRPQPHAETRSPETTRENDGARDYRLAARRGETQPQRPRTRGLRPAVGHHPGPDPRWLGCTCRMG